MNTKTSPYLTQAQPLTADQTGASADNSFAEFLILEACVSQCDSLAGEMTDLDQSSPLFAELSECIAACESYLAAQARGSRYAKRLATLCAEVCASTAQLCSLTGYPSARACRKLCLKGSQLLRPRPVRTTTVLDN